MALKRRSRPPLRRCRQASAIFRFIAAASLVCGAGSCFALEAVQEVSQADEALVKAELLLETKDFSAPFVAGLRFELAPDWYLYWMNPGDAGLAAEVRWTLPAGLKAGPLLYPVPEKFVSGGIVAFGYKKEVVLLCTITPGQDFQPGEKTVLTAEIDWLVCKESCLRGLSRVEVFPLKLREDDLRRGRGLLSGYRRKLPLPAGELGFSFGDVEMHRRGYRLEVEVTFAGPAASRVADFYPYQIEKGTFEHAGIRVERGRLFVPLSLFDATVSLESFKGLLIVEGPGRERKGYEVEIPLSPSPRPSPVQGERVFFSSFYE
ncbi:MAG: hypothetical protein FJY81_05390 [Candidatus Aminicenantes bacterium]|nr:hypothetical protein [Candidatus Aminicenantes bacterium]